MYNLLVIENSGPASNEAMVSNLGKAGFRVATYSDHLEALSKLGEFKPDLILLGELSSADSFAVCAQLRRAVDIPIVMMGEAPGGRAWSRAVESGADLYWSKTIRYSELAARIRAILRRNKRNRLEGKVGGR